MDKKKLYDLAEDRADEETIRRFDEALAPQVVKNPCTDFTHKVMQAIAQPEAKRSSFWHMWMIVAGVMVAIVAWALEGFYLPEINVPINLPEIANVKLPEAQSINMTNLTMIFMSVNALLALFLIDRWFQHRKQMH